MKKIFSLRILLIAVSLLTFSILLVSCGDDFTGSQTEVRIQTISASPTSEMNEGTTAIVGVYVTDLDGNPISGQTVTFTVTPSSLGYFTPISDTTLADGTVASVFRANSAGEATFSASATGSSKNYFMTIHQVAQSSGRLSLQVTPLLMLANNVDTANILITAQKKNGDPVEDGTIIYLTAGERFEDRDQDGYWTENIDSLIFDYNANDNWDPIGSIPATVATINGSATAKYTTGSNATTVYIRGTISDEDGVEFTEVTAKLNPNTSVASISMTHNGEDLRVKGVGGIEWSVVTVTAYDEFGNSVPEGIQIEFTIAAGPGGGENIQNEDYGPVLIQTNSLGQASVTINSGTISGTIKVRAASGTVLSAVTHLTINAGPPAHITVGAGNCNLRAWDMVNAANNISANVVDMWGNPVPDSTAVWFSTEEGFVIAQALTGVGWPKGIVGVEWYSGNPRNDGDVYVYACTDGGHYGQICDTVMFFASGPATTVGILTYPSYLIADGEDKGKVKVDVYDGNVNFVVDGTQVDFEADFGVIAGGGTQNGCYYSIYEADYTSEVLKRDYSPVHPDDGIGAISTVVVTGGGMGGPYQSFQTQFLTGDTYVKNSEIDIEQEIEPGLTVPFVITIRDRSGNPLGGHELSIFTNIGSVSVGNRITTKYGEVSLFFTAPGAVGTCIMTVTDLDPRGSVSFAKKIKIKFAD